MNILFASLISGILAGCAFNSSILSVLAWISLVPLWFALSRCETVKQAVVCGFVFGLSFNGACIYWIAHVSLIGLAMMLMYLSLYSIALCVVCRARMRSAYAILVIPCVWVILEFLKENVWCGFGWTNLAYSQYENLYFIQLADVFGAKFISFVVVAVNVFLWQALVEKKRRLWTGLLVTTLVCGSFLYSAIRLSTLRTDARIAVSVIQPNVAESMKNNVATESFVTGRLAELAGLTSNDSLVVFPEAAWPQVLREDDLTGPAGFVKSLERHTLIGAVTFEAGDFYNSALFFDPQGELRARYHKIRLVPFGEYVPLRKMFSFIEVLNSLGDMSRGKELTVFEYGGKTFSTLICFEDVSPGFVSRFARNRDFLVNITNDEWFGGQPEARQHLGILVLRAIENRRSMVRCANTGTSGWISYTGEIATLTKDTRAVFVEASKTYDLALNRSNSLYNKWGDFFPLGIIACVLVWCRRKERSKTL